MITYKQIELKTRYILHWKVLVCGINASSLQWCGFIFISYYIHLKLELLLHKTVLVTSLLASTVPHPRCTHEVGTSQYFSNISCKQLKAKKCLIASDMQEFTKISLIDSLKKIQWGESHIDISLNAREARKVYS